jgi:Ribbon-helix-helix protein, copG family
MAKVLVSLDERLLKRLDDEAAARGVSRSALLAEFASLGLGDAVGPGARPDVHEALRRTRQLFAGLNDPLDSTEAIRQMRDAQ